MTEVKTAGRGSGGARTPDSGAARTPSRSGLGGFFERYALVLITIAVFAFFSVYPGSKASFPTINNINVIVGSQTVVSLVAIGALFPLVSGYFDFSLGAIAAFSQVLCAGLMSWSHWPLWAAVVVPIVIGGAVGALNGLLITRAKMNPFVTTLGSGLLLAGIAAWYTNGAQIIGGIDIALLRFGSARFIGLPVVVFLVLLIALAAWYFLTQTPMGRSLYAIGSNAASARLVGIRVERDVWWCFVIGGVIAGAAGVIQLSRVGSAGASAGNELLFPALAAVFLGATTISPGFFNVIGTLIGAVFVSIAVSGLSISGAAGWASNVFNGFALLAAVGLSTYLGRRNRRG